MPLASKYTLGSLITIGTQKTGNYYNHEALSHKGFKDLMSKLCLKDWDIHQIHNLQLKSQQAWEVVLLTIKLIYYIQFRYCSFGLLFDIILQF
jgi:hypothetical protein